MHVRYCIPVVALLVLSGCGKSNQTAPPTPPPTPATIALAFNPSSVQPGQSSTLSWKVANVVSCTGTGAWSGAIPLSGSETIILQNSKTLTYTLSCTGSNGSVLQTASLTAALPPGGCGVNPTVRKMGDRRFSRHKKTTPAA